VSGISKRLAKVMTGVSSGITRVRNSRRVASRSGKSRPCFGGGGYGGRCTGDYDSTIGVMLELKIIGRRFQLLRRGFPADQPRRHATDDLSLPDIMRDD
jgi:hypothetical protein